MADIPSDPGLSGPWTAYRTWSCTSIHHKSVIDRLTRRSLWLGIAGAVLATLGQQLAPHDPTQGALMMLSRASGVLGAGAIALAAYLARQALANDRVQTWTRARGAAESLKSGIFLYRAAAPPFDGADRAAQLRARVEKFLDDLRNIELRPPDNKPEPSPRLSVDQYIASRVDDQVAYYEKRAGEHQAKADLFRRATSVMGGLSALLAIASAAAAISAWAAVIATITASITAHLKNQQYQMLAVTYRSTTLRLRLLKGEWAGSGKADADKAERNAFIQRCEDTMASENGAWVGLWTTKDSASPAAG